MYHRRNGLYYIEIVFDLFYNHVVLHEISSTIHLSVSYWWTFPSFVITNSAMMNNLQHTYLLIFLPMCFRGRTLRVEVTFQGEKIYTILLATVQFPSIRTVPFWWNSTNSAWEHVSQQLHKTSMLSIFEFLPIW